MKIAIANRKGGATKTTTAVNLAAAFAREGQRVLLIDADGQGNATTHLGHVPDDIEKTLADVLVDRISLASVMVTTPESNLTLVPANDSLDSIDSALAAAMGREWRLLEALEPYEQDYDTIFFDMAPATGIVFGNVLAAADGILMPCPMEALPVEGMAHAMKTFNAVERALRRKILVLGIVPTRVNDQLTETRRLEGELREAFGDLVCQTKIRVNVRLAEAPGFGMSVFQYAPTSPGAQDYQALAHELRGRITAFNGQREGKNL